MTDDLVKWRTKRHRAPRDGKDGRTEIVVRPDDEAVKALKEKLAKLEAQQLEPQNDTEPTPRAIGELLNDVTKQHQALQEFRHQVAEQLADIHRRIQALEEQPRDITPAEPAELQDNLDKLNEKVADIGKAMLTDLLEHNQRFETLETRVQNMPRRLLELYQNELKSIA